MSNELSVYGNKYSTHLFSLISEQAIDASEVVKATNSAWLDSNRYYYETKDTRYYYDVIPKEFKASFIAKARDDGLTPIDGAKFINLQNIGMTDLIDKQSKKVESGIIFFWVAWFILIGAIIYGYIALDNHYLY